MFGRLVIGWNLVFDVLMGLCLEAGRLVFSEKVLLGKIYFRFGLVSVWKVGSKLVFGI